MFRGDFADGVHIRSQTIQMNHDDGTGTWSDALFDLRGADVECRGIDVGKFWPCAERADSAARGDEREGWKDDLVASFYADGSQRQDERVRPGRDPDAVMHAAELCNLLFERGSLSAEHKMLGGQDSGDGIANLRADSGVLRRKVHLGNRL